jgi:hypothetical protein
MNKQGQDLQAYFGYLVDLYKIATFTFKNPHSYIKFQQIKKFSSKKPSKDAN